MSADPRTIQTQVPLPRREERKSAPDVKVHVTIPRDTEKEKIKRLLYSLIDRVDKL